jgi:hypothetical protein
MPRFPTKIKFWETVWLTLLLQESFPDSVCDFQFKRLTFTTKPYSAVIWNRFNEPVSSTQADVTAREPVVDKICVNGCECHDGLEHSDSSDRCTNKAVPLPPCRRQGGRKYSSYSFMTSALDGVSGQRHAPATLYPRVKDTLCPLYRRLGGPQSWSGHRG